MPPLEAFALDRAITQGYLLVPTLTRCRAWRAPEITQREQNLVLPPFEAISTQVWDLLLGLVVGIFCPAPSLLLLLGQVFREGWHTALFV